jgi:hypothetical protein
VRTAMRARATCEDGGGVMEEVVGGAGDANLARSGVRAIGMAYGTGEFERSEAVGAQR